MGNDIFSYNTLNVNHSRYDCSVVIMLKLIALTIFSVLILGTLWHIAGSPELDEVNEDDDFSGFGV